MRWSRIVDDEELVALLSQHRDEICRQCNAVAESLRDELRAVRAELTVMYSLLDRRLARLEPGGPEL